MHLLLMFLRRGCIVEGTIEPQHIAFLLPIYINTRLDKTIKREAECD